MEQRQKTNFVEPSRLSSSIMLGVIRLSLLDESLNFGRIWESFSLTKDGEGSDMGTSREEGEGTESWSVVVTFVVPESLTRCMRKEYVPSCM
jgi:hypothetical protein